MVYASCTIKIIISVVGWVVFVFLTNAKEVILVDSIIQILLMLICLPILSIDREAEFFSSLIACVYSPVTFYFLHLKDFFLL